PLPAQRPWWSRAWGEQSRGRGESLSPGGPWQGRRLPAECEAPRGWGLHSLARSHGLVVEEDQRGPAVDHFRECLVDRWVQHGADQVVHTLDGDLRLHLFLVRARCGESVVDLDGADDACAERDRFTRETIGVPLAIPSLVMASDECDHVLQMDQG